jgi:hypothetical protein
MKKLLISTAALTLLAGAAFAEERIPTKTGPVFDGSIEVGIKENDAGDYGATTTLNVGVASVGLAYGAASFEAVNGSAVELDEWQVGTMLGGVDISFGDQGGLFVESWSDYSDIADPAMAESIQTSFGDAAVALGFTDITSDITDISNVQGTYDLSLGTLEVAASVDYNFNSDDWAIGSRVEGIQLASIDFGTTMSYGSAAEVLAYELDGTVIGITGYVNGTSDDMLRNVGLGYEKGFGSMILEADVNYNIDSEKLAPGLTATFNF